MDKLTRNPAPQVCLRAFVPADRAAMLELLTDAAVAKTYMLPVFSAREEAVPLFERLLALSQDAARFVRCIEKDGAPVGILNDVEMTGETVELGWAVLPFMKQTLQVLTLPGFLLLLSGGIAYTIGAILYGIGSKVHWMHSVFHIFVVLGALLQFFAVMLYVL